MLLWPIFTAFGVSLLSSVIIVFTQRIHGKFTLDDREGIQKLHRSPIPRIGGIALLLGMVCGITAVPVAIDSLYWAVLGAGAFAFTGGLIEDITKRVGVRFRLMMTMVAGLVFCVTTGYGIYRIDVPGVDLILSLWPVGLLFTAFAIAGIANAINIIDGVNGLASGTVIIILAGFAILAFRSDDQFLLALCLVMIATLAGFFVVNFPMGKLFLGDAGAYATGYLLAVVAIMLPQRNPEVPPLLGLLAVSYPVFETLISIQRRISRIGTNPGQPDRLHLHSLVYQRRAGRLADALGIPQMRNPITTVIVLALPTLSTLLMLLASESTSLSLLCTVLVGAVYVAAYRRVALLGSIFTLGRGSLALLRKPSGVPAGSIHQPISHTVAPVRQGSDK